MPYSTKTDIENRWSPEEVLVVADRDGDGAIDSAEETGVIDPAIADADAEIDTYIGAKYALPLAETPSVVRRLSVDLAMYHMSTNAGVMSELKQQRHDDAIRMLKDLASGKADLGLATSVATEGVGAKIVSVDEDSRTFTRESTRGLL